MSPLLALLKAEAADTFAERAAIAEHDGGLPHEHAEVFAALHAAPLPADVTSDARHKVIEAAARFLERQRAALRNKEQQDTPSPIAATICTKRRPARRRRSSDTCRCPPSSGSPQRAAGVIVLELTAAGVSVEALGRSWCSTSLSRSS
jgi:hypothetical protein